MPRPLIGITSYLGPARWGHWVREASVVATPFLREVDRAGGLPVVLAPVHPRRIPDLLHRIDGFVFTTGAPVGADTEAENADPRRDRFEIELIRAVLDAGRPFSRSNADCRFSTSPWAARYCPPPTPVRASPTPR